MLSELEDLAREKSSDRRRELLHKLTDSFMLEPEKKTQIQMSLYDDILCKIVGQVEHSIKNEFSERIAPSPHAPKGIILKLANDSIDVAAHVLRLSPVLTDEDLIKVANNKSQEHLYAISNRKYVSERVTDVLIDKGDARVHHAVVQNDGARISDVKMPFMLSFSQKNPELLKKLQEKKAKQSQLIESLVDDLNVELKKRLADKDVIMDKDSDVFFDSLLSEEVQGRVFKDKVERLNVKLIAHKVRNNEMQPDGIFITLSNADQFMDVGMLLSELHELPADAGFEALMNTKVEPMMLLMKAAGCTERGMEAVLKMRAKRLGLPNRNDALLATFNALTPDMAHRVIRFLKIRQSAAVATADAPSSETNAA